jgi:hypothetical protein
MTRSTLVLAAVLAVAACSTSEPPKPPANAGTLVVRVIYQDSHAAIPGGRFKVSGRGHSVTGRANKHGVATFPLAPGYYTVDTIDPGYTGVGYSNCVGNGAPLKVTTHRRTTTVVSCAVNR